MEIDKITKDIFNQNLVRLGKIKEIAASNNISKLLNYDNYLLILSRSGNSLKVYDLTKNAVVKTIAVGNKPIDVKYSKSRNKIYVLSAQLNNISVIDGNDFEVVNLIPLKIPAFPEYKHN
ncbi:MAG: hypothetical protein MZU79_02100 [Anaerotruncus sp.]|nr:hypothetical protein [Anaerotruncus sp.]